MGINRHFKLFLIIILILRCKNADIYVGNYFYENGKFYSGILHYYGNVCEDSKPVKEHSSLEIERGLPVKYNCLIGSYNATADTIIYLFDSNALVFTKEIKAQYISYIFEIEPPISKSNKSNLIYIGTNNTNETENRLKLNWEKFKILFRGIKSINLISANIWICKYPFQADIFNKEIKNTAKILVID